MPETTPLIKAALNLRVGAGFDVYENITLNALCELVNLNRTSWNQKFKAQFCCTCMEYLLNYRLKISQELLSNSNMKIHEIAESCGFNYDSYFVKQFTAKLGISPAKYRKNPLIYSAYDGKKLEKRENDHFLFLIILLV